MLNNGTGNGLSFVRSVEAVDDSVCGETGAGGLDSDTGKEGGEGMAIERGCFADCFVRASL
jgi:hypothetical protein